MEKKVRSIERALTILECFSLDHPEITLAEISRSTNLPKSTISRILNTMENMGYIKQDPQTQKYSLGFKLFHLGSVVGGTITLRKVAVPYMNRLCKEVKETTILSIVEKYERVCIEVVESLEQIRNFVKVGQRNRLYIGTSGKVLLAFSDQQTIDHVLSTAGEELTKAEMDKLQTDLRDIVQQGYSFMKGERVAGSFAVASPIFDSTRQCVGVISAAGPIHRMDNDPSNLIKKVKECCLSISRELGYTN